MDISSNEPFKNNNCNKEEGDFNIDTSQGVRDKQETNITREFICERCGHEATTKGNLMLHLRKKSVCAAINSDRTREEIIKNLTRVGKTKTHKCNYCESMFSTPQGKHQHMQVCAYHPKKKLDTLMLINKKLCEEIVNIRLEFQQEILKLKQQISQMSGTTVQKVVEDRTTIDSNKKKKKQKIPQPLRVLCWNTYVNENIGKTKCLCCGITDITPFNFNCGHVIAESKGGKTVIENLRPICSGCNNSMGSENLEDFKKRFFR